MLTGVSVEIVSVRQQNRAQLRLKRLALLLCFSPALPGLGQATHGELQLNISDPGSHGVRAAVRIVSQANQLSTSIYTNAEGQSTIGHLPFGLYRVEIHESGFADVAETVEIRSSIPVHRSIQLKISSVNQSVVVTSADTLIDPYQAGSVNEIGSEQIENRVGSIPGRSIQDLVNSQPGWLYEGNAVLHPRGSEYQTQFVVDGIPLTDNRSPSFGPEIEADDVDSMSIYTAGIPAEYGRKMGGVVEINTQQNSDPGFHGQVTLYGGSFTSAGAFAKGQYVWGKNTFSVSGDGSRTDHYLNPVVTQNYSNTGTLGDFAIDYRRQLTSNDKISLSVRHELARYDIPNEQVQQIAGQRQNADNFETMGIASWQHTFSSNATADVRGMVRDNSNDFYSNPNSIPVYVEQHNSFREGYFKAAVTINHGRQEWKAGVESDNIFLHENTCYTVTEDDDDDDAQLTTLRHLRSIRPRDAAPFGSSCAAVADDDDPPFIYQDQRPDLEQSAFLQDRIRLGNWTIAAGLRYDHYQLILNDWALQPRFSIARYFPSANTVLHFSYDRVFQTPSFENLLLSSSTQVESIDPTDFLRLPVKPSVGDYYEVGSSTVLAKHLKLDANYYRRFVNDYADDDQIDSTSISFPIAFRKAIIYGAEGKITVPEWHRFSGFASYSYMVGNVWNPVTGGLFLGDDADEAASALTGHFPDSQDQRNSVRGRVRYQAHPRVWIALGVQYDTGLPFEFSCDPSLTTQECIQGQAALYGQDVVDRINFDRGRILPSFQVNASAGAALYRSDRMKINLQADGTNLNDVLDVIDFGGLFSGNAIGPSRSFSLRLNTTF
jgi:TonB-dependent Receptor Plug Domain